MLRRGKRFVMSGFSHTAPTAPFEHMPTQAQGRTWFFLIVGLLFLNTYMHHEWQVYQRGEQEPGIDFAVYYVAGRVALGEGEGRLYYPETMGSADASSSLFSISVPDGTPWQQVASQHGYPNTLKFTYPPLFALFFSPLSHLPARLSLFIWRQVMTVLGLVSVALILRMMDVRLSAHVVVPAMIGAMCFYPVQRQLALGQVGALVLCFWTLGAWLVARSRPGWSGAAFALATLIKVTPVIVVPFFLWRRQWRWLIGYGAALVVLLGISIGWFGWESHVIYFTQMMPEIARWAASPVNKSITGLILGVFHTDRLYDPGWMSDAPLSEWGMALGKTLSLGLYGGALVFLARKPASNIGLAHGACLLALISLLMSPVSWRHHFVLALLPLTVLWIQCSLREGFTNLDAALLLAASLAIGSSFPDFLMKLTGSRVVDFALHAVMTVGTFLAVGLYARQFRQVCGPAPSGRREG